MPFSGGESWRISCAYQEDSNGACKTHRPDQKDEYALDFNWGDQGYSDCGKSIVAVAKGTVVYAGWYNGYGWTVDINHNDNYTTRYAHLQSTSVISGDNVTQGQEIGKCGSSGGDWSCHLHFVLYHNNWSTPPEPMSGYTGFVHDGGPYLSNNYFNLTNFTFPNHSSQGWICGFDTQTISQTQTDLNTWMIAANGSNPGVVSPSFANGINTNQFKRLKFSARVDGSGSSSSGYVWIKDNSGDWEHGVYFGSVPRDYNYHGYTVNLAGAFSNLDISQISIELTENGGYEHWIFDWVKLISSYYHWNFTDSQLGWTIRQHCQFADFFDNTFWRIKPTGKQPQIVSPYLENISSDYIQLGIRYSAQGSNDTAVVRAYFDIGNGFGSVYSLSSILRDGTTKTVIFDIPASAIGNIQKVMFDLFDNNDYQNRLIAINKINFLKGDDTDDSDFVISGSGGGIYEPENLTATATSTNQINLTWNRGLNPPEYANLRYRIYRNDLAITTTTNMNYSNTNLSSNTQYCYKVTAYIDDNESDYSNTDCATTNADIPIANFTTDKTSGYAPLTVIFTDISSGNIIDYNWDFGDGSSSVNQNTTHTFLSSGNYTVVHTVNGSGGSNSKTIIIIVTNNESEEDDTLNKPDVPVSFRVESSN